jgi:hypothetical protein
VKLLTIPCKGTWLLSIGFLTATIWHSVFRDGRGFLISLLLTVALLIFTAASVIFAVGDRSQIAWRRCLICGIAIGSFIPTIVAGNHLREWLLVRDLPHLRKIVDYMVAHGGGEIPRPLRSYLIGKRAGVNRGPNGLVIVLFLDGDSSAVGHGGIAYISSDDARDIHRSFPEMGCGRFAPNWYEWAD